MNTWNYIISKFDVVSKESIKTFKGIRFKNGAIRTIHPCNALHEDFEKSKDGILAYRIENDSKCYSINVGNETVSWKFGSEINQRMSIEEGESSIRKFVNIIPISYIDNNVFKEIVMNILKQDKKHKGLPIIIATRDDRDAIIMDVGKIRNICSALDNMK